MWERPKQAYFSKKAQALLELAVFGSIIIMLIGILINYGLRYNLQVKSMQDAYRKALKYASEAVNGESPSSVSYVSIEDIHIPDPSNPFAIGAIIPISASASVTRNPKMDETANEIDQLPRIAIDIKGSSCPGSYLSPKGSPPPCYYLAAGFREEQNVDENYIEKYKEIYGDVEETDGICLGGMIPSQDSGPATCLRPSKNIRIIDSCEGEVIDYGTAFRQCRQFVDEDFCEKECEKGKSPDSEADCHSVCGHIINVPWYCSPYTTDSSGKYVFETLNKMFSSGAKGRVMGLQPDYEKNITTSRNVLTKDETASGITTTESADWHDQTKRTFIYKEYNDKSGDSSIEEEIISSVYPEPEVKNKTWQTAW